MGTTDAKDITTTGRLAAFLLKHFPPQTAELWDNVGLLQGDALEELQGIALALNAIPSTVEKAAHVGCNVLVTHHPAYLDERQPDPIPASDNLDVSLAQATLARAKELGVALIALHTNLDVSDEAVRLPAELTGYPYIDRLMGPPCLGSYGGIFATKADSAEKIAEVFAQSYHCHAQILGTNPLPLSTSIPERIAFCSGSLDVAVGTAALRQGIDLIVSGEVHYHNALELALAGATLIELGHDASEEPYVDLLRRVVSRAVRHRKIECIKSEPLLLSVK